MVPPVRRVGSEFKREMSLQTDKVQTPNVVDVREQIARTRERNAALQSYLNKYPWAQGWTLENLIQFERNAQPISVNGVVRTPITYKPKVATISADTKTKAQHEQGQKRAQQELEKSKQLKETEQAAEIVNNPYNPIGWIPGLRTMVNVGADRQYSRLTGQAWTPYTTNAAISAGTDAFGIGPWKNYIGAYAGNVAGGIIGDKFGNQELGQFIGGLTGGFSPNIYKPVQYKINNYLVARTINKSIKDNPYFNVFSNNPAYYDTGKGVQDYYNYITSLFPDSKVKGLVYHQTYTPFQNVDFSKVRRGYGLYFSPYNKHLFGTKSVTARVNLENPVWNDNTFNITGIGFGVKKGKLKIEGHDGAVGYSAPKVADKGELNKGFLNANEPSLAEIVVTDPSKIHILGSYSDLNGFIKSNFNSNSNFQHHLYTDLPIFNKKLPELYRRVKSNNNPRFTEDDTFSGYKIKDGKFQVTNPEYRWFYDDGKGDYAGEITNFTTFNKVYNHSFGDWSTGDLFIFDPAILHGHKVVSTEPMDTFVHGSIVESPLNKMALVSGNDQALQFAEENGIPFYTSKKLQDAFNRYRYSPYSMRSRDGVTLKPKQPKDISSAAKEYDLLIEQYIKQNRPKYTQHNLDLLNAETNPIIPGYTWTRRDWEIQSPTVVQNPSYIKAFSFQDSRDVFENKDLYRDDVMYNLLPRVENDYRESLNINEKSK